MASERLQALRPAGLEAVSSAVAAIEGAGGLSAYAAADAVRSLLRNWHATAGEGNADPEAFKDDYRRLLKELQDRETSLYRAIDEEFGQASTPSPR